ncbi:hypothetical protein LshimejAT787_0700660 [Lyophyllum shimeji]|uniref:Uncharacterized protein n=1 Tax=Lyophyllum shimeji TaxID=47721 RepID=A0A9P3PQJ8_LYOSH|nr:hypothetical protein LshimejAT787_0700660 [Lyophyllum shimeji]
MASQWLPVCTAQRRYRSPSTLPTRPAIRESPAPRDRAHKRSKPHRPLSSGGRLHRHVTSRREPACFERSAPPGRSRLLAQVGGSRTVTLRLRQQALTSS